MGFGEIFLGVISRRSIVPKRVNTLRRHKNKPSGTKSGARSDQTTKSRFEVCILGRFWWFLGFSKSIFSSKRRAMPEIFTPIESQWVWLQLMHKRLGVLSQGNSWEFFEKNFYGKSSKNIGKRDFLIDD